MFSQMLFVQGPLGVLYGSYVLQGYGEGTVARHHFSAIQSGPPLSIEISDANYILKNTSDQAAECCLLTVMGEAPRIL